MVKYKKKNLISNTTGSWNNAPMLNKEYERLRHSLQIILNKALHNNLNNSTKNSFIKYLYMYKNIMAP